MLKGVGFEIRDLGTSVDADAFIKAIKEYQPHILGPSALLTTTILQMKTIIQAISEAGLRGKVKVIVGGAPVNQKFAHDIGADGYAEDAGAAVSVAKKLMTN